MSLLADRDFLLHALRLNYVRSVLPNHAPAGNAPGTGPYNLISFDADSSTVTSPYVVAAGLADTGRWPELNSGRSSPPLAPMYGRSDSSLNPADHRRRSAGQASSTTTAGDGPAGPGLDYTQTIGKGPASIGMRVTGRRSWKGKRRPSEKVLKDGTQDHDGFHEVLGESFGRSPLERSIHRKRLSDQSVAAGVAPPPIVLHSPSQSSPLESPRNYLNNDISLSLHRQENLDPVNTVTSDAAQPSSALVSSPPLMAASPLESALKTDAEGPRLMLDISASPASPDGDSSSSSLVPASPISNSTSAQDTAANSLSQGILISDASLGTSLSQSGKAGSNQMTASPEQGDLSLPAQTQLDADQPAARPVPMFAGPAGFRPRERRRVNVSGRLLVPIVEPSNGDKTTPAVTASAVQSGAVRLRTVSEDERIRKSEGRPSSRDEAQHSDSTEQTTRSASRRRRRTHRRPSSEHLMFRKRTTPAHPQVSALTVMLQAQTNGESSSNPFARLYAAMASTGPDALKLKVYFPQSNSPSKPLLLSVKRDLIVEEVIGAGLYTFWEEGRQPLIEVEEQGDDGDETAKWNLRIVEDDGEVDEDFPALDRLRSISAFSFGEFAIVPALGAQIKDNLAKQASIQRRPSRILGPKRAISQNAVQPTNPDGPEGLMPADVIASTSLLPPNIPEGVSSGTASVITLKVKFSPTHGVDGGTSTLQVPSDMYLNDVLGYICRKRGLENVKDWALIVKHNRNNVIVPLDRHVDSLGGKHEVVVMPRTSLAGARSLKPTVLQNTNPSASIFAPRHDAGPPKYQTAADMASSASYQKWNVQRKLPVPLGRHPRCIVIDGDYIHFLTMDSKGMAETGRTSSFHISNVKDCRLSRRSTSAFKITVRKNHGEKRYDFEAEDGNEAIDIVHQTKALMATWQAEEAARLAQRNLL
ncbi:Component of a membrane-bound complex containing the Tor2p kinase [Microbotryomycetes sp. JL201]|nr:Component of a membrane-bound complex containing the Tor2p kinase [Microbotryomycetes sp. JL201]